MYWHKCLFGCWCHVCLPWSIYLVIFAFIPGIFVCQSEAAGVSYVKLSQGAWHGGRLKKISLTQGDTGYKHLSS